MIYNIGDYHNAEIVMSFEQWEAEHRRRKRKAMVEKVKWYFVLGTFAALNLLAVIHWLLMGY